MSSIERAKSFMQRKARLIALTAVPLASLVGITPAKAIAVTPTALILDPNGTDTCSVSVSATSGGPNLNSGSSCTVAQLGMGSNGVTGVKMYGNGPGTLASGGSLTVSFILTGSTNDGILPVGSVPISWDFMIADSNSEASVDWTVTVGATILGVGPETVFTQTTDGVSPGATGITITGSAMPTIGSAVEVTAYSVNFSVTDPDIVDGGQLTVTIPNGSTVDVNSLSTPTGVPEPATFGLLGFALAALGSLAWWRRRSTS